MNTFRSLMKHLCVVAMALTLSACGSAPAIRASKRIDETAAKTEQITFVYRQGAMKTVSSYGSGSSRADETGFHNFGKHLTDQAPAILASYGVNVLSSRLIDTKDANDSKINDAPDVTATGHILLLYASSGRVSGTRHATSISYIFDARLLDASSRKTLWVASIDTSTWSGRDFIQKNFQKTLYDEKYAEQLLRLIADKMKADGLI